MDRETSPIPGGVEPHPPHHSGTRCYLRYRMCKRREHTSLGGDIEEIKKLSRLVHEWAKEEIEKYGRLDMAELEAEERRKDYETNKAT